MVPVKEALFGQDAKGSFDRALISGCLHVLSTSIAISTFKTNPELSVNIMNLCRIFFLPSGFFQLGAVFARGFKDRK